MYVSSSGFRCMDPLATGDDPLAATDNGSCTYPLRFLGVWTLWQRTDPLATATMDRVHILRFLGVWTRSQRIMIRWQQPTMDRVRIPLLVYGPARSNYDPLATATMDRCVSPSSGSWVVWTLWQRILIRWQQPTMGRACIPLLLSLGVWTTLATEYDPSAATDRSCVSSSGSWVYGPVCNGILIRWQPQTTGRVLIPPPKSNKRIQK
jgi:hypothetical protein